ELALDEAGTAGRVDQPAGADAALGAVAIVSDLMPGVGRLICQRELRDRRAVDELHAEGLRMVREEVLEDAAIELIARRGEETARAELDDVVDGLAPLREKEPKAKLLELAADEMLAQAQHAFEIV